MDCRTIFFECLMSNKAMFSDSCHFADIIFVLDSSGSVGLDNWFVLLGFVKQVVGILNVSPDDAQIGIVTYGNSASLAFHLNEFQTVADIQARIGTYYFQNDTILFLSILFNYFWMECSLIFIYK